MRSILGETSERSLALAEFSGRAPLTKLYPSLKNVPPQVRKSKTVLNLEFWIPRRGFWIPGTGFRTLSVELGFRIPMVSRIPDSMSKKFSDSAIRTPLHRAKSSTVALHPLLTSESIKLTVKWREAVVELG